MNLFKRVALTLGMRTSCCNAPKRYVRTWGKYICSKCHRWVRN